MSIIQDALKKAEDRTVTGVMDKKGPVKGKTVFFYNRPINHAAQAQPVTGGSGRASSGIKPREVMTLFLALVFILGVVIIGGLVIKKTAPYKSRNQANGMVKTDNAGGHEDVLTKNEEAKHKATGDKPFKDVLANVTDSLIKQAYSDFVLSGVMYLEGEPRAIINNAVVMKDDNIGGATVIRIDKDKVTLKANEAEIVLRVN